MIVHTYEDLNAARIGDQTPQHHDDIVSWHIICTLGHFPTDKTTHTTAYDGQGVAHLLE